MVDALHGAPGVYSARYGHKNSDAERVEYLLENMKNVPDKERTAKFVCVITCLWPEGRKIVARGECPGRICTRCMAATALAMTRCSMCRSRARRLPSFRRRRKMPSRTGRGHCRNFADCMRE